MYPAVWGDPHGQPAFGDPLLQEQGWGNTTPGEEAGAGGAFFRGRGVGTVWCTVGRDSGKPCRDGSSNGSVDGVIRWLFPHGMREAGCEEQVRSICTMQDAVFAFCPCAGETGPRSRPIALPLRFAVIASGEWRGCLDKRSL